MYIFSCSEITKQRVSVSLGFVWALRAAEGCFVATVTTFVNIRPVCGGLDTSFLPKSVPALFLFQSTCQINLYPCWMSDAHDWSCSKSSLFSCSIMFTFSWAPHVFVPPEQSRVYLVVAESSEERCVIALPQLFHCLLVHTLVSQCVARCVHNVDVERCL